MRAIELSKIWLAAAALVVLTACSPSPTPQKTATSAAPAASVQTTAALQDTRSFRITDTEGHVTVLANADFYESTRYSKMDFRHGVPIHQGAGVVAVDWARVSRLTRLSAGYDAPFRLELTDGTRVEGKIDATQTLWGASNTGSFTVSEESIATIEALTPPGK